MSADEDPFDEVLGLEEKFYEEGYALGVADGKHAGLIEGRLFGLEKGFEKYYTMGELHGKAKMWTARCSGGEGIDLATPKDSDPKNINHGEQTSNEEIIPTKPIGQQTPKRSRLGNHVRILQELTDVETLSTANTEDDVADFDDRLKRAEGKMKIIEKITGETDAGESGIPTTTTTTTQAKGDGSIEDASSLNARH